MRTATPGLATIESRRKAGPQAIAGPKDGAKMSAVANHIEIVPHSEKFSHDEACRVARAALVRQQGQTVIIDLRYAREVTTAAFVRLVLLFRTPPAMGGDLRLTNLHDRAASLYQVNRLMSVLPCT
jgi:ABC-type transporter Mla MlaB component